MEPLRRLKLALDLQNDACGEAKWENTASMDTPAAQASLYADHVTTMTDRLAEALSGTGFDGLAVFSGSLLSPARDDTHYPFRVEPHFASWLPLTDVPDAALLLEPGRKPVLLYPQPQDFWHAPPKPPQGDWTAHFDIRFHKDAREFEAMLKSRKSHYGSIGDRPLTLEGIGIKDGDEVMNRLDFARARKTPYEIECMASASLLAARAHRAVADAYSKHLSEFELHQIYCTAIRKTENELPYSNIVAQNRHAAILHYQRLDRGPPRTQRSLLIDAGAGFAGYAADVTRTYSAGSGPFRDLIDAMDDLQQTLCAETKAGVDFVALNERAHRLLAEVLMEQGLIVCSSDEAFDTGLTRIFLPHGLGHLLGLQVHDTGGLMRSADGELRPAPPEHPFLRLTRVLEIGMALTVEPGLYFIPALLEGMQPVERRRLNIAAIEALIPYGGIRVEDNLIVESAIAKNLTRDAFAASD